MTERFVHLCFFIDTNRINARRRLPHMNQLEVWHRNDVITIEIPEEAYYEVLATKSPKHIQKAKEYIRTIENYHAIRKHEPVIKEIEKILFPYGVYSQNQWNDVMIVFNARRNLAILITDDGDSHSQPNGILGNRDKLAELGIQVMRDSEAIELVKEKIQERDNLARDIAGYTDQRVPDWVGVD